MNAAEISRALAARAVDVVELLLPEGKRKGQEVKVGNTSGEPGESLSVRVSGAKAGVWKDFSSGESGDLIDLWMACRGQSMPEAMKSIKAFLGIRDDAPRPPERVYRRPAKPSVRTPKARVAEWLTSRGLTEETIKAFKVGEMQQSGKVYAVFPFIDDTGELINVKYRNPDDKKDMRQEKDAAPCLFGWHLIEPKARTVAITEGEIDAMTLHQMGVPALSVNQGAGNHQWIEIDWDRLERFSDILVCFDNDPPGDKGAAEVISRLGIERCRRVRLGAKDANQWLQDGAEPYDFKMAMDDARPLDPDELHSADDYTPQVEALFYPPPGAPAEPALRLDKEVDWFYFRRGEYTCWTGINGHGKSLMLDQILLGLMKQGERVVIFSGEMPPAKHLKRIHKQATGVDRPTRQYIHAVGAWLRDKCWLFDLVGTAKLDRLLEVFAYAARRYGVRHFVIDSLMMIDVPQDGPGAISRQNEAVQKIVVFKKTYDAHVHLVAHPRKGRDETEAPGKMDVAGAGGIVNGADNVFSIWKAPKDEAPPNTTDEEAIAEWQKQQEDIDAKLILKKSRYGEHQDYTWRLWFDKASMQYRSQPRRLPFHYVDFSTQEPSNEHEHL
ncbi:bifunctional DNA primase/helicase [Rhodoferax koreense]|uniref:Bifunctional DNA primase/helicase n=1 Tax=Rhodoferax koreensis TaxID=1842727 RepID=A0A1P8JTQ5_9BURK|nr:AAA family ATPase [Rhodoferax koreense]APW37147.1 bifunctional DNA primase/helicase [Rhodoferax koreense]